MDKTWQTTGSSGDPFQNKNMFEEFQLCGSYRLLVRILIYAGIKYDS